MPYRKRGAYGSQPQRRLACIWLAVTVASVGGWFLPSAIGLAGEDGGYALIFFCVVLAVTAACSASLRDAEGGLLDGPGGTILSASTITVTYTYELKP